MNKQGISIVGVVVAIVITAVVVKVIWDWLHPPLAWTANPASLQKSYKEFQARYGKTTLANGNDSLEATIILWLPAKKDPQANVTAAPTVKDVQNVISQAVKIKNLTENNVHINLVTPGGFSLNRKDSDQNNVNYDEGNICTGYFAEIKVDQTKNNMREILSTLSDYMFSHKETSFTSDPEGIWSTKSNSSIIQSNSNNYINSEKYLDMLSINTNGRNYSTRKGGSGWEITLLDTGIDKDMFSELSNDNNSKLDTIRHWGTSFSIPPIGLNLQQNSESDTAQQGHGTYEAILAVGQKQGIAPDALLSSIQVCNNTVCSTSSITRGICYAIEKSNNPKKLILNMSFSGLNPIFHLSEAIKIALKYSFVVVAGGNKHKNNDLEEFPAAFNHNPKDKDTKPSEPSTIDSDRMFSVASITAIGISKIIKAAGSNGCGNIHCGFNPRTISDPKVIKFSPSDFTTIARYIDLSSFGDSLELDNTNNIYKKCINPLNQSSDGFCYLSGTSFAAPLVSGVLALNEGKLNSQLTTPPRENMLSVYCEFSNVPVDVVKEQICQLPQGKQP